MDQGDLGEYYAALGVQPGVSLEELERVFMAFVFVQLPEKFKWGACRYAYTRFTQQLTSLAGRGTTT